MRCVLLSFALLASLAMAALAADPDILIADFEGQSYGKWKTTGDAFGKGPAHGTLPNQQPVSGFEGKGLVNSYLNGDKTTGTLTSPPITIERRWINFLVGGGHQPGQLCVNLLVDGKVVRAETGGDDETLAWATWDVGNLQGKTAQIQIVDRATEGWGHINVDQIVQSEKAKVAPYVPEPLYQEQYRPQFHFTASRNWLNDPNGLVFYKGEYHLFFQHNPSGINWGNMTWGHAVSTDLFHWKQLEHALEPDRLGTIFSGSAVIDWNNTTGFQTGDEKVIVAIYTSAGDTSAESKGQPFTQSIAYSNDRGRTWTKYDHNPVLKHILGGNRDPKVFWHAPSKQWVMALYLDGAKYALFGSPNLKQWTKLSDVKPLGADECPDMFELPVDSDPQNTRWVFWGGNNNYAIGRFDGRTFTTDAGPFHFEFGENYYAAQSYSDVPAADGRRIQIGWMRGGKYPRMPFNQQMSLPSELVLRTFPEGIRMCRRPVRELDSLHGKRHTWSGVLEGGKNPLSAVSGELFDLRTEIEPGDSSEVVVTVRGTPVTLNSKKKELACLGKIAPLGPIDGKIQLQILVDRSSIEVFGNDGQVSLSACFVPPASNKNLEITAKGGKAKVKSLDAWELSGAMKP